MNTLLSNLKWVAAALGALLWIGFHVWMLHSWFGLNMDLAIWDSMISNVLLLIGTVVLRESLLHYIPTLGRGWYALMLGLLLSAVSVWGAHHALEPLGQGNHHYIVFFKLSIPVRWAFDFVVMMSVAGISLINTQLKEQHEMIQREAHTKAMAREAELQKLQLQLQPHFLFNSLNSINALIQVRPAQAREMVQHLSDFLRITMRRADEHWVTLDDEWKYLQLYLEIEKVRFGHRLCVESSFQDDIGHCKIPTLLLQPLVENAIKFGLYGTTGAVTIQVRAAAEESLLLLSITNPTDEDTRPQKGNGFGISGLKRRLYLLFARNDLLETQTTEGLFTVTLKVPPPPADKVTPVVSKTSATAVVQDKTVKTEHL